MVVIETENHKFGYDITSLDQLLFINVGMAMTRIQNFESTIAAILCSLDIPDDENLSIDDYDKFLGKLDDKTLGRLVRLMTQKVEGKELHEKLISARDGRNFIAHHALRGYPDFTEDDVVHLVKKIEEIMEEIERVQHLLIEALSAQNVTHISRIYIDFETGEIMSSDENERK